MSQAIDTTKSPSDIQRLFDEDPLNLTRSDIDELIRVYRNARHLFASGNVKAGSIKAPTAKQKAVSSLAAKINLDGIDL